MPLKINKEECYSAMTPYLSSAGFTKNFSWTLTVSCLRPAVELIKSTRTALKLVRISPDQLEYCTKKSQQNIS